MRNSYASFQPYTEAEDNHVPQVSRDIEDRTARLQADARRFSSSQRLVSDPV